jgi:hypothetical protein
MWRVLERILEEAAMEFDLHRFRQNIREAHTEDLLDRVTVYRLGMEPLAVDLIEAELHQRGVTSDEIDRHAANRERQVIFGPDGIAATCSFCHDPAVATAWDWHRLFKWVPLFPRRFYYCEAHLPGSQ